MVEAALVAETRGRRGENYILSGGWHSTVELGAVRPGSDGYPRSPVRLPDRCRANLGAVSGRLGPLSGGAVRNTRETR